MRVGIDASNIRAGGGLTHLSELLRAADPPKHGISKVIVWGAAATLAKLPPQKWLELVHDRSLDGSLPARYYWQRKKLTAIAEQQCELLFVPGGTYDGAFRPFVTMSQNFLPFDAKEWQRFGISWKSLRYMLLRGSHKRSFQKADGMIFLTNFTSSHIRRTVKLRGRQAIIPYGINPCFYREPRSQRPIDEYSMENPFKILYVSIVNFYKHQWHVVEAAAQLRQRGLPIQLDLIGPAYEPALNQLKKTIERVDPRGEFVNYLGPVPYLSLVEHYHGADSFVFASSCESMPNVLVEAMASGLPIACSKMGPMPEVLGEGGLYFDPEQPRQIAETLTDLIESPSLRERLSQIAYARSHNYSWERCADETFSFLAEVGGRGAKHNQTGQNGARAAR